MAKKINYSQHGKFFSLVKRIVKLFKKNPLIINENESFANKAIFISNHSAASGPMVLSLYFPKLFVPWGAHPMTEGYKQRWDYLYHVFYTQKLGYGKVRSYILATLFAIVSRLLYRGMRLIPTYTDMRLLRTFHLSDEVINQDTAILVFPEDSSKGYHEVLTKYNIGFVSYALHYYKRYKIDLPIYVVYFNKRLNVMMVEKPTFIQEMVKKGMTRKEIANYFKDKTNDMGEKAKEIVLNKEKAAN